MPPDHHPLRASLSDGLAFGVELASDLAFAAAFAFALGLCTFFMFFSGLAFGVELALDLAFAAVFAFGTCSGSAQGIGSLELRAVSWSFIS